MVPKGTTTKIVVNLENHYYFKITPEDCEEKEKSLVFQEESGKAGKGVDSKVNFQEAVAIREVVEQI